MSKKDSYQRICQKLAAMDEGDVYPQMDGGFVCLCFFCKGDWGKHKPQCIYRRAKKLLSQEWSEARKNE